MRKSHTRRDQIKSKTTCPEISWRKQDQKRFFRTSANMTLPEVRMNELHRRQKSELQLKNPMRPEGNERCPKTKVNKCLNSPWFLESRGISHYPERKPKNGDVLWLFRSPHAHQYSWIGVGCGYGDCISERLRRGFNEMSVHMKSFGWMRLIFLLLATLPDSWLQCWRVR